MYWSWSSAWAASDPLPIAFASCFMNVPDGSVWKLQAHQGGVASARRRPSGGQVERDVQLGSTLVDTGNQQRHSERSGLPDERVKLRSAMEAKLRPAWP